MKFNKKMLAIAAGVLVIICAVCITTCTLTRKTTVGFYGLDENQVTAFETVIDAVPLKNNKPASFKYIVYDNQKTLASQMRGSRKCDLLVTYGGLDAQAAAARSDRRKAGFSADLIKDMPSSLRGAALTGKNKNVTALPLLIDNFEIDIDTEVLHKTGIKTIATWQDIEKYAIAAKKAGAGQILFAGKDDSMFLDMIGAVAEALDGTESYSSAAKIVQEAAAKSETFNPNSLADALAASEGTPLYKTIQFLARWNDEGLLFSETFNMTQKDVNAFMAAKSAPVALMTLSAHRTVEHSAIERYASIYVPSVQPASSRSFSAPLIYAVPLKKSGRVNALASGLVTASVQESLSRAAGLAPVLAHCRTPDHQADDARYWVAATNTPLSGFSRDACTDPEQRKVLADTLRGLIRFPSASSK